MKQGQCSLKSCFEMCVQGAFLKTVSRVQTKRANLFISRPNIQKQQTRNQYYNSGKSTCHQKQTKNQQMFKDKWVFRCGETYMEKFSFSCTDGLSRYVFVNRETAMLSRWRTEECLRQLLAISKWFSAWAIILMINNNNYSDISANAEMMMTDHGL